MTKTFQFAPKVRMLAAVAPLAMVFGAAPVFAQTAATPAAAQSDDTVTPDIVVTGTLFKTAITPSPVTTVTTEDLDKRGINTVQDALQQLSAANGPSLTNSFSANGAFAGGASSISLRGLSTNSTLVLFDGLRAAYYPLADDGSRNFVDLNTIPDDIVDRIDVLKDGASSSYGADAIAGVVNVITKRSVKGVMGRVEAGVSQDGTGANQRLTLTAGTGDLDEKGFNAYVSGFYYHTQAVYNRDLRAPFNTANQNGVTGELGSGPNGIFNGREPDGSFTGFVLPYDFYVRPYSSDGYANGVQNGGTAQGRYQKLNPNSACYGGSSTVLSAAELADTATNGTAVPSGIICQEDYVNDYQVVTPNVTRYGGSAHFSAKVGDSAEAYALFSFQQSTVDYTGFPPTLRGNAPTGIDYPRFTTSSGASAAFADGSGILALPVYVCAARVNCTAANGTLNPNNPFAAQGFVARITGRIPTVVSNETRSRVYRGAIGIKGTVFGDVDYQVDATAMHTDLRLKKTGYVYIQHLLDVIADGSYNFVNPSANSAAVINYLTPTSITNDSSDLDQVQFTARKPLTQLPGGPLQLALGGSVFYEAVNAPSANPDYNGPTERYFTINAFGTIGHRTVASAFGELDAPILDSLDVNVSGRYDHYSTGQSAFSPKVGFTYKPIRQVTLRGTYSRGFRIPSFGEANALPTTGYVSQVAANIPANVRAQYGAACLATPSSCPQYLTQYSIGLTTLASPNLKPEKSRSFTAGIIVKPIPNVTLTVDYYNIVKTGAITAPSSAPAIAAYYAGQAIPAGYNVIADAPDVNNPGALPRIAFVESQLINANKLNSSGIDFGATGRFTIGGVKWTSAIDASLALELSTTFPGGAKETYVGTLGNFNLTAGSGTFRWRGNWQNTLDFGKIVFTGTVNYTSGYNLSAQDQGTGYKDCGLSPGYGSCNVKSYITFDSNLSFKVNDKFTFYVNVINLFDRLPPVDPVTYGAYLYNPVQAGNNILGRQFRGGVKFGF
ncbi:MAG: TonB-dependent receptor [Sphingomonas sp.]|uniref:TonB-dependent receptor domain-containing protein n=1 Tax=Sphingomonas sp. TaxID=28214 RepID=UPI0035622FCB